MVLAEPELLGQTRRWIMRATSAVTHRITAARHSGGNLGLVHTRRPKHLTEYPNSITRKHHQANTPSQNRRQRRHSPARRQPLPL